MTTPKNPRSVGLPMTMPAAEVLKNIAKGKELDQRRAAKRGRVAVAALRPVEGLPFGQKAPGEDAMTKAQQAQASFKASYRVGDTTPSKVDLRIKDMPGPLLLEVTSIDGYDHNPRLYRNESYEDLEASIRANGFTDSLTVTRRRDGDRFMLAAGSNTTLEILKNLWNTTGEERFRWVNCVYQPYEGDTKLLAQHLGENLNRGNMKFWEIASGMVELLQMIERERGTPDTPAALSVRDQAEALTSRGLRADKTSVARWRFTVDRLQSLGLATVSLTPRAVSDFLQPRLLAIRSLASKFKISEDDYWALIVNPVLAAYGPELDGSSVDGFDPSTLCDRVEAALAERVDESVASIRNMLSVLKLSPELTLADLRMPSPNAVAGGGSGSASDAAMNGVLAQQGRAPVQAPLSLGPGVVREGGRTPGSLAAPQSPTGQATPGASAGQLSTPATTLAQQPTASGALFAEPEASGDPLHDLHDAVQRVLATAQLSDTLRWHDALPLGFFLELPDSQTHARRKVELGSPEFHFRAVKSTVWWSLVLMTGQYREGVVPFMDHSSAFYKHFATDTGGNPLDGTDIEHSPPEADELLMHRITPAPLREVMRQMRAVEECAARVFEALPERWRRMVEIHYASNRG